MDATAVLTQSVNPAAYWRKLKERLLKEGGNETVTKCHALKMVAPEGKRRLIDVADTEVMLVSFSLFHRQMRNHLNCGWRGWDMNV